MALKIASTGPLPRAVFQIASPSIMRSISAVCGAFGARDHAQARYLDGVVGMGDLVVDQRDDVLVEHVALAVAQILEALERIDQARCRCSV